MILNKLKDKTFPSITLKIFLYLVSQHPLTLHFLKKIRKQNSAHLLLGAISI